MIKRATASLHHNSIGRAASTPTLFIDALKSH